MKNTPLNSTLINHVVALLVGVLCISPCSAQYPTSTLWGGGAYFNFGTSVAGDYDLNGDGKHDLVVGIPGVSSSNGQIRIYTSKGILLQTINGPSGGDSFGTVVLSPGDLNGDGYPDILISAKGTANCTTGGHAGYVKALLGPTFSTTYYTINGAIGDQFGATMAVIGDMDGDGVKDFIVGAPAQSRQNPSDYCSLTKGGAYVYSGKTGNLLYSYSGTNYGDDFGGGVGPVGDVNADGKPDFAISSGTLLHSAYTKVYSGANGGVLYTASVNVGNNSVSSNAPIAPLGDVNGDGKPDFIIGDTHANTSTGTEGSVHVVSGSDGTVLYTINGAAQEDYMGGAVIGLVDLNSDGKPDFAVGARGNGTTRGGYVKVLSGSNGSTISTLYPIPDMEGYFGSSLAPLGDINGDGTTFFAVGTSSDTRGYTAEGSVRIFLAPFGLTTSPDDLIDYHSITNKVYAPF